MKTSIKREQKEFKPIELNITLETREEEIFWISILNSSCKTWEEIYIEGASVLPNIPVLSKKESTSVILNMSQLYHALTAQTTEDTSGD